MRTDANAGASFDAGGSDYAWAWHQLTFATSPSHLVQGDNADSEMLLGSSGGGTNQRASFEVTLYNPSNTEYTKMLGQISYFLSTNVGISAFFGGTRLSAALVDAVQFLSANDDTTAGTIKIYGLRA